MPKQTASFLAAALIMGALAIPTFAQDNTQPQPQQGRQRFDPTQMRQMMNDRLKEALGASDDEMQALGPKIDRIMQLQRDARSGGGMGLLFRRTGQGGAPGGGGPGGGPPGGTDPNAPPSATQQKLNDLQTTLDNKDAKVDEIKARLAALRDARNQAKAELARAEDDLRGLLTQRQEAALVMYGILE